jgi:hypothetical protein
MILTFHITTDESTHAVSVHDLVHQVVGRELLEEEDRPYLCRHDIRGRVYAGQCQLLVVTSCKVRWSYL